MTSLLPRSLILLVLSSLLLSACSGLPFNLPQLTSAQPSETPAPPAVETSAPTQTPRKLSNPSPTPSLTPKGESSPTPSSSEPTTDPLLGDAKFLAIAWLPNNILLITIQFTAPVSADAYNVTFEDQPFKCEVLAEYADRYYCNGQIATVKRLGMLRIYQKDFSNPGFEKGLTIPPVE